MTIKDICTLYDKLLNVRWNPGLKIWQCSIDRTEVRETSHDPIIKGEWGSGDTAELAAVDYCKRIAGKYLVFNMNPATQIRIPDDITHGLFCCRKF